MDSCTSLIIIVSSSFPLAKVLRNILLLSVFRVANSNHFVSKIDRKNRALPRTFKINRFVYDLLSNSNGINQWIGLTAVVITCWKRYKKWSHICFDVCRTKIHDDLVNLWLACVANFGHFVSKIDRKNCAFSKVLKIKRFDDDLLCNSSGINQWIGLTAVVFTCWKRYKKWGHICFDVCRAKIRDLWRFGEPCALPAWQIRAISFQRLIGRSVFSQKHSKSNGPSMIYYLTRAV